MPDIFIGEGKNKADEPTKNQKNDPVVELMKPAKEDEEHNHAHLFAAYCENPPNVKIADLLDDEEILLFLRRHFVTNIPWVVKAIGLAAVPFIIWLVTTFGLISIDFISPNYQFMILVFYYFLIVGYVFVSYLSWFYNISLVTTLRIIDIDFSQIVFENVEATKLTQVEDVGYVQIGVLRSIFDYGDVNLHTAGPASNFEFLAVPHPERVVKVINNLTGEATNA